MFTSAALKPCRSKLTEVVRHVSQVTRGCVALSSQSVTRQVGPPSLSIRATAPLCLKSSDTVAYSYRILIRASQRPLHLKPAGVFGGGRGVGGGSGFPNNKPAPRGLG